MGWKTLPRLAQAPKETTEQYITFDDVFTLALARTQATQFVSDSQIWQRTLYEIWGRYRNQIPALDEMFFDIRPALPPQTNEFYELISILSTSGLISLPNPNYTFIQMNTSQKKKAKKLEEDLLRDYSSQINEIAEILQDQLAQRK